MSLLLPGVLGSASCLKDLACVLPRSFSLVILYFIFYSGQMEVLFSVSVVARGNQGGLYVFFFFKGNDLLYLWKLTLSGVSATRIFFFSFHVLSL